MWFGLISLFPEMFKCLEFGITGRAIKKKIIQLHYWNPRNFTDDKHQSVDDKPYGGGAGMVMMAPPLQAAIESAKKAAPAKPLVIYLSPQGKKFNQAAAKNLTHSSSIILLAGRYEGIDQRVIDSVIDQQWSIGDYILSGGELAAMVMIDAITRLLPNALGDSESALQDSLTMGLLKYPQYTRPENVNGLTVPSVLRNGNHEYINAWRLKQSLGRTWLERPDLLEKIKLSSSEDNLLNEYIEEFFCTENTRNAEKIKLESHNLQEDQENDQ